MAQIDLRFHQRCGSVWPWRWSWRWRPTPWGSPRTCQRPPPAAPVEGAVLTSDREMVKKLADARKLLEEGRFGEAIRNLDGILEAPEDSFFQPDKKSPLHRSLKAEAQRLLGELPPEGRELYELQYGARASKMLDEALAANDPERLAEVSRRFFHTRSGSQATYLLGLHYLEPRSTAGRRVGVATPARGRAAGRRVRAGLVALAGGLLAAGRRYGPGPAVAGRSAQARPDAPRNDRRSGSPAV